MPERRLPTGTITFLFSDIEGSTRLVQELGPAAFTSVLERHNAILRATFARHGGTERGTQGDSFLVLFREAPAAVAAAGEVVRALAATTWPAGAAVRVRMGLHSGVGMRGGDDYVGLDVHRAARIAAAAHGGQVLVSDATRALAEDRLPAGLSFRALGTHRLRDIARPEKLHQLVIEGTPSDFPPVRTLEPVAGNLPARVTSFVGRGRELALLGDLLAAHRLVTLTGPGGSGKTSLAIEAVRLVGQRFPDGTWFVPLEAVRDPALAAAAITASLRLEGGTSTPVERLREYLGTRSLLLLLDNFEQILEAAPLLGELLQSAPALRLVVTSRAPLRIAAEQEFPVAPLPVPAGGGDADAAALDAIRLWTDRAARARPGYMLPPEDVPAVLEICRRVDGLPLGIELAAARAALLPPGTIARRLARRLDLPGTTGRDLPERQRTLTDVIGWSYELLGPGERRLLDRLGVFAGGCRLIEAEAVCGPATELGVDVLDGLSTLVDHSLVEAVAGQDGPRFRLLSTVRLFALARLDESPDAMTIRRRHAESYLAMAEEVAPRFPGRGQAPLLDRLAADHDNLRAAVDWAVTSGAAEVGLRFAAALWRFWQLRGHLDEGSAEVARILGMSGAPDPALAARRAAALGAAGGIAWWRADLEGADRFYAEQVRLAREVGEPGGLAEALFNYAHTAMLLAPPGVGAAIRDEALQLYRSAGDRRGEGRIRWLDASLDVRTDPLGARVELEKLLREYVEIGDIFYAAMAAGSIAWASLMAGDVDAAITEGLRSVALSSEIHDSTGTTIGLRELAILVRQLGQVREASILDGAVNALSDLYGVKPPSAFEVIAQRAVELGPSFEPIPDEERLELEARGAGMSLGETIDFAAAILADRQRGEGATGPG